jgi:hypothetical protein
MALDREWEKFKGGPRPLARDHVHVTLNRQSVFFLNDAALRLMGNPEAVHLYFNRNKDKIALTPASPRLSDAFPIRVKSNGCRVVLASTFCQHYGIQMDATHKFVGADLDSEGNLVLDLSNTVIVASPRRRKPRT